MYFGGREIGSGAAGGGTGGGAGIQSELCRRNIAVVVKKSKDWPARVKQREMYVAGSWLQAAKLCGVCARHSVGGGSK